MVLFERGCQLHYGMTFKPQPWDTGLIIDRRLVPGASVRVLRPREAIGLGLLDIGPLESRMLAEWCLLGDRLAIVKPNLSTGLPTHHGSYRMLECERICWDVVKKLGFKNFNEAYAVDWQNGQGLKIVSPVVNGLQDAETLTVEQRRKLILRHPEAAAEFMAQKIITGDFDDKPHNYVVREDGQSLVRIDYGCAFWGDKPESNTWPLTTLMNCVTLEELMKDTRFVVKMRAIADTLESVPGAFWQHIVDTAKHLNKDEKSEIVQQLRTGASRLRRTIDVPFSMTAASRPLARKKPGLKAVPR